MESLGALDQLFYKADQYGVGSLIMGAASILAPAQTGETLDARATADHLCARLGCIPLLRKKLVQDPLRIGCVYKVDDLDFDVRSHIDVQSIASPGGYSELAQAIGELTSTPLELSKLWHWTVLEGLEGGKLAVVCRIHHALADGIGISEVLSSMYDPQPVQPESPTTNPPVSNAGPGRISLLGNAVMESSRRLYIDTPRFVIKSARPVLAALGEKLSSQIQGRGLQAADEAPYFVQATSLNTAHKSTWRKIAWRTLDLPEIKQIARELGCSVNDVGLYLYSCALEHYLAAIGEAVDFDLWCGMPVNTRSSDPGQQGGNQVSNGKVCLSNTLADPVARLQAISASAHNARESALDAYPVVSMEELGDVIPPATVDSLLYLSQRFDLLGRVGKTYPVMHSVLSNVPGPPTTLYIANGAVVESIPVIPAMDVIAVSGGFVSIGTAITIGFNCDGDAVDDPDLLAAGVDIGMANLRRCVKASKKPKKAKRVKKAKKAKGRASRV